MCVAKASLNATSVHLHPYTPFQVSEEKTLKFPSVCKIEPYPKVNPQHNQTKMGGQIKSNI
ncbi:MAG: hypothetical protein C4323_03165 [Mastigocladus sp. ERB_26_2]